MRHKDEILKLIKDIVKNEIVGIYYDDKHNGNLSIILYNNSGELQSTSLPIHMTEDIFKYIKDNYLKSFIELYNECAYVKNISFLFNDTKHDKVDVIFINNENFIYLPYMYGTLRRINLDYIDMDNTNDNFKLIDNL